MAEGLASADLRQRAVVGQLRRTKGGNGDRPSDPLDDALSMRRKLAAQKIVDQSLAETDASAISAENMRLKAQIENRQLREGMEGKGKDDSWREYLADQVHELRGALAETQKALTDQQLNGLNERLAMLQEELGRVQKERSNGPSTPTGNAAVRAALEDAKELLDFAAPPAKEITPMPPTRDPALEAWMVKIQIEQERWKAEREDTHRERMSAQTAEHELKGRALAIEEEKAKRFDRFIVETAPKLIELGQALLEKLMPGPGAAAASVAPSMPQVAPAATAGQLPEGAQVSVCQNCGKPIVFRPSWSEVICSNCGTEYKLTPDNTGGQSTVTERPGAQYAEEEQ